MRHKLLVVHASHCVEVGFDQQLTIGRDVYNSLCLQDPEVSRSHAIIFEQDPDVIVKDLKSRNGLYVCGEKTPESVLRPGDELIVGATVMFFDPSAELDLENALSKRARYLIEKRAQADHAAPPAVDPVSSFTCAEMDAAVEKMLAGEEQSEFLSVSHAVQLLEAYKMMDATGDAKELFESAVTIALTLVGGDRGMVVESASDKKSFKPLVQSERSKLSAPAIDDAALRMAWDSQKCLFNAGAPREGRLTLGTSQGRRVIYSFAAVPIRAADGVVGVLGLESEGAAISYDFAALRTLYLVSLHVGALLRPRALHSGRPTFGVVSLRP